MAILAEFQAHVYVNGVQANEFDDEDEEPANPNEVNKYVEAISGACFEVKCLVDHSYKFRDDDALSCSLFLDGSKERHGRLLMADSFARHRALGISSDVLIEGKRAMGPKGTVLYKFQFANLETHQYGALGTIKVEIWRVRIHGEGHLGAATEKTLEAVPEKALKGRPLDVATKLTLSATPIGSKSYQTTNVGTGPLATFNFKYRTRRGLQSLMILERSPTPPPLEERPVEELTREEMTELIRRQREQLPLVKEENKLKRERSSIVTNTRPLKSTKGNNGETISHLESDDDEDEDEEDSEIEELPRPKRTEVEVVELL